MESWEERIPYGDPARPRAPRRPLGQRDDPDYRTDEDDEPEDAED